MNSKRAGRHNGEEGRPLFRPNSSIELSNRFDVLRELEEEDTGPAAPTSGSTSVRVDTSKTSGRGTSKSTSVRVDTSKTSGRGTSKRTPGDVPPREVQRAGKRETGTFLRDKEDWRFDRREFRALQEEFGTFTLDRRVRT